MSEDSPKITRRRALGGALGLAGVAALAGCTSSEQQREYANTALQAAQQSPPPRPSNPGQQEYARYVLDSLEYQNSMAQAQTQAVAALVEDAGISGGDE